MIKRKSLSMFFITAILTILMATSCFAATWKGYFGVNEGWFEGAEGKLTSQSTTGWSAKMLSIGWGGCWGAETKCSVDVKKGYYYTLRCKLKSSKCDKWVFIKIGDKNSKFAYGKWIHLKKGKTYTLNETFKAKQNAKTLKFGFGGEFGDRKDIDKDAKERYSYASSIRGLNDGDPTYSTIITCSEFSLTTGSYSAVKKVKASKPTPKISNKKIILYEGKTKKLSVKNADEKIKWSSSKKKVATVNSNGKVYAKGKGKATITAKIGGKKLKCKVTVKEKPAQYGSLNGSVTYFYNNFKGNVSDTGAYVYLISKSGSAKSIPTFSSYVEWILPSMVNKYNEDGVYMCNVDGAGKYAFNHVKAGKYLLVMVSAKTTDGDAFRNLYDYQESFAYNISPLLSNDNTILFRQVVGQNKYWIQSIEIYPNQNSYYGHDFGITYI